MLLMTISWTSVGMTVVQTTAGLLLLALSPSGSHGAVVQLLKPGRDVHTLKARLVLLCSCESAQAAYNAIKAVSDGA